MEKSELPPEKVKRISELYGRAPGGITFQHKPQTERKYFDSGDYALTASGKTTDNGLLTTGETHPHRENISRPHASVPANTNVQEDANENPRDQKSSDFMPTSSPLFQRTNGEKEKATSLK